MITLGIDLAANPEVTGGCLVDWRSGHAVVEWARTGLDDSVLLREAKGANVVGIDAPFGWPRYFAEAVAAHHSGRPWPVESWDATSRRQLRLRATDEHVHDVAGITPLSVSSDLIAIPTMRCAGLLASLGVRDRAGMGGRARGRQVFEVYPAAALKQWGFRHRSYKGGKNTRNLKELFGRLRAKAPWLEFSGDSKHVCATCDDAFDALVASLVARAASKRLTLRPSGKSLVAARIEGWIALPEKGSLESLPAKTSPDVRISR